MMLQFSQFSGPVHKPCQSVALWCCITASFNLFHSQHRSTNCHISQWRKQQICILWWNSTTCTAMCPHNGGRSNPSTDDVEYKRREREKKKKCTDVRIKTFPVPFHMQLSITLSLSEALDCSALGGSPCGGQWDTTHLAPSVSHLHPSAGFSSSCLSVSSTSSPRQQA